MKVILLQELKGRGAEGDVIEVAHGFAVNYLLPRKVAIEATSGNLKQLEARMHNIRKRDEVRLADAGQLSSSLEGKSVGIEAKVGDEGRLYGSITAQMIEDAIREQLGVEVDRRKIETHGHIKELGAHPVEISIYREVKAQLIVNVVPEGGAPEAFVAAGTPTEVVQVEAEDTPEADAWAETDVDVDVAEIAKADEAGDEDVSGESEAANEDTADEAEEAAGE
jgi:large subunit ribosomal protein L9